MLHHFLLTRFNLRLWSQDKTARTIDPDKWIERRMALFETYCLPSVMGQSCGDFTWVLLIDAHTPSAVMKRLYRNKKQCPQMYLVRVQSEYGLHFAEIFSQVVDQLLSEQQAKEGDRCLTTFLDNDDCLAQDFVAETQRCCKDLAAPCFLSFDYGLQVYTEMEHFTTRICYPNNHFLTFTETVTGEGFKPKTCYGYGSHFLLQKYGLAQVEHVSDASHPMWIELIHSENIDNDVKMTFSTRFVTDKTLLRQRFSLDMDILPNHQMSFILRAIQQMWRRGKMKLSHKKHFTIDKDGNFSNVDKRKI